ncbi:MAG: long-chain-fatty-acid--CoA ligase [Bryobacterales bacterium]|nr:long-chain-fatty-acid--CoA ligase [Bryobacteraceae bacterium]MDW8355536.1 long-chain-fatty-acid--CoA ligase [Bryobacterales bacterium]
MPTPLTPIRFLYRAVDLFGKKTGVISGDRRFSYAEFGARCERLASALRNEGLQAGDRVAYLSFNTHRLLEGYYGVVMAGAVVMPLNVRLSAVELTQILNHSGAKLLFFENDFLPLVEHLRSGCSSIRKFVPLDGPVAEGGEHYEAFLERGSPGRVDWTGVDENSPAELFYTSGSTGTPKGVVLSHRTLYLHAMSVALLYEDGDRTVDLHTIPLFHANGWGHAHSATMLGATQVMVRRFEPSSVFQLIQEHRATDMSLVPTMANALLNAPDRERYDLSSMKRIMIGGAASSPELIERMEKAFRCQVMAGYGLTETAPVLTVAKPKSTIQPATEAERYRRQAMAGWPVPGVEIRVVDSQMRDVPRDMQTIGEIVARGDHLMTGYFQDPEGTAAVMTDGWFHTGDMAVWDEEGYVHIVDRKKEIIISGGENISSLEIEKAICAHPDVYECAVVACPDDTWGEVPAAIVYRKPGAELTTEALLEFLGTRLARFKLPRRIEFTSEPLPKTGTGKIRKLELRERFWAGKERRVQG